MFVSSAFAQASGGTGAGGGLEAILPLVLIFVVFYFLLIRPQQKKMKQHRETLAAIRRGDKIVTGGGIIGTVIKVDDVEQITVEIAKDVKVKVRRELVSTVLSKPQPVSDSGSAQKAPPEKSGGFLSSLLGASNNQREVPASAESSSDASEPAQKKKKSKP